MHSGMESRKASQPNCGRLAAAVILVEWRKVVHRQAVQVLPGFTECGKDSLAEPRPAPIVVGRGRHFIRSLCLGSRANSLLSLMLSNLGTFTAASPSKVSDLLSHLLQNAENLPCLG